MAIIRPAAERLGVPIVVVNEYDQKTVGAADTTVPSDLGENALIVYTSGTTGRPKGVLVRHEALETQITALVKAWEWVPEDRILSVLPLHHVHGIVAVQLCAAWVGATAEMLPKFDAAVTWQRLTRGGSDRLSLFMAVPTI
eukprot:CAMPEP_0113700580 /NCGR_PEP_ID=MMETSP0038_2-20120614/24051_1 /TAXON_ID=2898 /ORGANISM="Cryptomonas paramecium" /LENGTH=140 /DNA_ID=CAMNT_0000624283 /DNA_START=325 /DNA_END=744 /DNA_ORIENTATION=- /assembly_acc=CAM_ASM_000170